MLNLLKSLPGFKEEGLTENQKKFFEFICKKEPPYEKQFLNEHNSRAVKILQGEILPPHEVEIQPSSICNLKCKHCFGRALSCKNLENKMGEKEMEIIAERIKEYKKDNFRIENIKFCGTTGEPLINPAMLYGIELFKKFGINIILFTNGLYLDRKYNGKKYLDYILNIERMNLSLDAGSEDTFERSKGKKGFNRIIKSLEEIAQKREQKPKINVSYVIGKENYHEIEKTARIISKTGADELRFRVDFTKPEEIHPLSNQIISLLNKARAYSNDKFKVLSPYSDSQIKEDDSAFSSCGRRCFTQYIWACVGSDCGLYACGHRTYFGVGSYESLLDYSFQELWEGEKRKKYLNSLPDNFCRFCSPFSVRINELMTFLSNAYSKN